MKSLATMVLLSWVGWAQMPKPVPPEGIAVPPAERAELEAGLNRLKTATAKLGTNPLLPDVLVFQQAVRYALDYGEFFKADEFAKGKALLAAGEERARLLSQGQAPWTTASGLVVRGYISKIDRSVQPYGLVVPPSYSPTAPHRWRLDTWFHGRSENLSEVNFLADRMKNQGEFAPRDTIVLHLYGRYCNASKFAGEVDTFEALDAVKKAYAIDDNRVLVRGFSMGGASAWHLGVHYAGLWAAVQPGAGFTEAEQYLKLKTDGPNAPTWWERVLFHMYNATDYAANLFNTATVAYNGEIDPQAQAADMMEHSMAEEGLRMIRIVGPQTPHRFHPDSKVEIDRILDAIAERGNNPYPKQVRFTTWTLAYNQMKWVIVDEMGKHWERARVNARVSGDNSIDVDTQNVTAFTLSMDAGGYPLDLAGQPEVTIDGERLMAAGPMSDRSWTAHFRKTEMRWAVTNGGQDADLHKRHGLQGPIDDAFLDSFVFVSPTGTPLAAAVAPWVAAEEKRAIAVWRSQFRGDAQVRTDTTVTDADIAGSNLVLWGDPGSNRVLARIADRLPIKWTAEGITVGSHRYPANHAAILIYPNPLNPKKYVVLNSGFTFREESNASNARQIPKLPDYAVVDTSTPPNAHWPGKVALAGFFDESWKLQ